MHQGLENIFFYSFSFMSLQNNPVKEFGTPNDMTLLSGDLKENAQHR